MAKSFEDLFIWQEARTLTNEVYNIVDKSNDYGFKEQIQRAVVSIMNNIAEGFESGSNAKIINFLNIANGSCSEVRSMLYLCEDFHYCDEQKRTELQSASRQISAGIKSLISRLTSTSE